MSADKTHRKFDPLEPSSTFQRRRVTIAEIESTFTARMSERWKSEWENLKLQIREGDELLEFCSDIDSWKRLMGAAGYALVRDGKSVVTLITKRN